MFNLRPDRLSSRQTQGRDLSSLLRMQQQSGQSILDELNKYGQRKRGGELLEQIKAMTPEERAKANIPTMVGENTQSKQTLDALGQIMKADEAQKDRDARDAYLDKQFLKSAALAKIKNSGKGKEEEQSIPEESKAAVSKALQDTDKQIALLRGQITTARPQDRAHILAKIQNQIRAKTQMEKMLDPEYSRGTETRVLDTILPGNRQMGDLFPIQKYYKEPVKKEKRWWE